MWGSLTRPPHHVIRGIPGSLLQGIPQWASFTRELPALLPEPLQDLDPA
ncbi:MAG: hypothetical protein RL247_999 [Actinomycetota bacterium]|jgi:hypothetical protein